ncbi:MAG: hypothetical protein JWN76_2306 [Chitinophagaceae bacterium]|nr:hypothetical protein [Chitinophagaceae bacterium]
MKLIKLKAYLLLLAILVFINYGNLQAQTAPMYAQYMFNMMHINPAYAGSRGVPNVTALFRQQWVGLPGEPRTGVISADMPLKNNKLGIGLQLYNDRLGIERSTGMNLSLATRVTLSNKAFLSAGLQAGIMNYQANLTEVSTFTPNDPAFYNNINKWIPLVGVGLFYNTDKFYAGISAPDVLKSRLTAIDNVNTGVKGVNDFHVFFTSGYVFKINEDLNLKPSMLVKMVNGSNAQLDLNANLWIKNTVAVGASYRTGDAVIGMVEWQVTPQLRFGYAYEKSISKLKSFNQGSHEFMIRYEFGSGSNTILSPRYF